MSTVNMDAFIDATGRLDKSLEDLSRQAQTSGIDTPALDYIQRKLGIMNAVALFSYAMSDGFQGSDTDREIMMWESLKALDFKGVDKPFDAGISGIQGLLDFAGNPDTGGGDSVLGAMQWLIALFSENMKELREREYGVSPELDAWHAALDDVEAFLKEALNSIKDGASWLSRLIDDVVNSDFLAALNFTPRSDPLALDLDGDGIETISADAGVVFDTDGDGLKTGTGWVKGDDGLLVLDRNGNGRIDSGAELFGVDTLKANGQKAADGFDALRDLDSNGDGVFDAQDEQFANMRVWQDLNQDGIAQAHELKSLAEHDIAAINLNSTASNTTANGNRVSAVGTFVRGDGSQGQAANLDLASNPFYREYGDRVALNEQDRQLATMQGSGAVRDLREAAAGNQVLRNALSTYSTADTRQEQLTQLDDLNRAWVATSIFKAWGERIAC